jgi:hypothetical protein
MIVTLRSVTAVGAILASAAAPAATLSELASNVDASGWVSASYIHSFIDADLANTRATDIESDSFQLNQAVLNLGTSAEEGFGAFVSIMLGEDADRLVNSSYGEGTGDKFSLPEAYITYGTGSWLFRAGRFGTLAGYEVVSDAANPLLSRSLQFPAAEPYYHTGVRGSFAASDAVTLHLGLSNSAFGGFADDTNEQKTVEAGVAFTFSDAFSLGIYDYYGVENDIGDVNYLDVVAQFKASDALTFALNLDIYSDDFVDITGLAAYATFAFSDVWSATLRLETLERDFDVDPSLTINAATIALAYTPVQSFRLLLEGRIDDADEDVFLDDASTGELTQTQPTVGIKAIYSFGL